jgi:hypothetical protein
MGMPAAAAIAISQYTDQMERDRRGLRRPAFLDQQFSSGPKPEASAVEMPD